LSVFREIQNGFRITDSGHTKRPSDLSEPPPHFPERTLLRTASRAFAAPNLRIRAQRINNPLSDPMQRQLARHIVKPVRRADRLTVTNSNRGYPQDLSTRVCSQVSNRNFRESPR
jgi:hypothetical protein